MKNFKVGLRLNALLGMLLALTLVSFLMGCGGKQAVPAGKPPKAYTQLKIQASEHWRDMAVEVAERVLMAVEDRCDIQGRPIHIVHPNNRPFSVAFYNLLRTELVSRGMQVSYDREPGDVVLEYTVQTVPFDASRFGTGDTHYAPPSDNEIIVNARLFYQNRFVLHCSAIRYINDADWALYIDPQVADPKAESSRSVRVTNR